MPRILVADHLADEGLRILSREESLSVDHRPGPSEQDLIALIPAYEGLVVRSATRVPASVIEAGSRLKLIGRAGIGVDTIDVDAATRRGIVVMNTPLGNVSSAAEHTLALLFSCARNVARADHLMRQKRWEKGSLVGVELSGKVLGVVGLGKVGSHVARVARAAGMTVIAYDPFLSSEKAAEMGVRLVPVETVVADSDFITLHVPLNEKTKNLIGAAEFKRMKKNARIINCARGGVVDEKALHAALKSREIAGAALDVFEQEPLGESPLLELDNVTLTPHLGASTEEAQRKVAVDIANQFVSYFKSGVVENAVNIASVADPKLVPYMALAEKLGNLATQLGGNHVRQVELACLGDLAGRDTRPLTIAALKGALTPVCGDEVNLVNAAVLAQERGIRLVESRSRDLQGYVSLMTVRILSETGESTIAGTVTQESEPRVVRINQYEVDLRPAEHLLVMFYPDRPGMVGKFGTILGNHQLNIARMEVGRRARGGQAVVILTMDDAVPPAVLDEMRQAVQVEDLRAVRL
ncbi:MAG: phosphoglycerate dehydrogenase [Planctomycetes bacterium]|nr:phosphoglycerate dehydrogenase [Planctomycetota bacterium]